MLSWFKWRGYAPSIWEFALLDLFITSAYTLIALGGVALGNSTLGMLVSAWVELMDAPVSSVLFFLPAESPGMPRNLADGLRIYRHSVVMCSAITIACIIISEKFWPAWSQQFLRRLRRKQSSATQYSAQIATTFRYSVIGIASAVFLLLLAEPRDAASVDFLYGHRWATLRAPLLLGLACYFACHTLMLRRLLPPQHAD